MVIRLDNDAFLEYWNKFFSFIVIIVMSVYDKFAVP